MTTQISDVITTTKTLAESGPVAEAFHSIIRELTQARSTITAARPPIAELAEPYQDYLRRQTVTKGKEPLYSYVGSGIGNGPLVQLADGSVKWDMINGIGVHMFGHSDPDLVTTALRGALVDTVMQGNLQFNPSAIEAAERLVAEASRSSRMKHCFLINSGALANESAVKICFQENAPADRVITFRHSFAGRTIAMVSIGDSAAGRVGIPITMPVDYVPFYDPDQPETSAKAAVARLDELLERYPGRHACFAMELVQGEGGFNVAPREFFMPLLERCREHGIGIWADEIQTFGRTGEMFCYETLEIGEYIDVVTVGKLSQVCACLYTAEYNPQPGLLSATFVGSTVALYVGQRMIERLRDGGYFGPDGRIAGLQKAFREHAGALIERHPQWFPPLEYPGGHTSTRFVDGIGGMMRLTPFGGKRDKIMQALHTMFDEGVIAFYCGRGPFHIRLLPPIGVMEPQQFDDVFTIMETALAKTASS